MAIQRLTLAEAIEAVRQGFDTGLSDAHDLAEFLFEAEAEKNTAGMEDGRERRGKELELINKELGFLVEAVNEETAVHETGVEPTYVAASEI